MQEKKYLKWYHKIGYGSGDIAGNCVYALLTAFMMIYLTDTIGLSMGIVSTLIAASKIFDGVSDFFFGRMIDKTKTKMGKARPWMLWAYIGCAITLVACFSIPTSWGQTAQYIFFFLSYRALHRVQQPAHPYGHQQGNLAEAAGLCDQVPPLLHRLKCGPAHRGRQYSDP